MFIKYTFFFCVFLLVVNAEANVKREASSAGPPTLNVDSLKKNMRDFKDCIDKSLADIVGEINEDRLQPVFNVIGDQLNRFSRAFDEITAMKPKSSANEN